MITKERLRRLAKAKSEQGLFVSAYLTTSRLDERQAAPTFLNSEFSRILRDGSFTSEEKRILQADFARLLSLLDYDLDPEVQGLAIFINGHEGVHERLELPLRLANLLVVDTYPYLRPLVRALFLLEPFVILRVSRDDSSIYMVDEGRLVWEQHFAGPYLKSTDRETGRTPVKEYYAAARQETLVEQHFKDVAAALDDTLEETQARRVVLCGQHDIVSNFYRFLNQGATHRIAAEIPWDAALTTNQLVAGAREAVLVGHRHKTEALVDRIHESLGAQGTGVAGFADTVGALVWGQLQVLVVDDDYRPEGWRCRECGFVALSPVDVCPVCPGAVVPVSDAVADAIRIGILQSDDIEVAQNTPLLTEMGGIAGLLRFRRTESLPGTAGSLHR